MTAAQETMRKKTGRRPKHKDEVLGAFVSVCIPRPFHSELLQEARAAGYTRPQFLRILLKSGLTTWRAADQRAAADCERHGKESLPSANSDFVTGDPFTKRGA